VGKTLWGILGLVGDAWSCWSTSLLDRGTLIPYCERRWSADIGHLAQSGLPHL
jgi:hypothetical protein